MKQKANTFGRAVPAAHNSLNLMKEGVVWVHQGIAQEEIDPVKAVGKDREERLQHLVETAKQSQDPQAD